MDFLTDVSSKCTTGDSTCIQLGKRACDSNTNCWGFAVHSGWGVQIYDNKASNPSACDGTNGLKSNGGWDTYMKLSCGKTDIYQILIFY